MTERFVSAEAEETDFLAEFVLFDEILKQRLCFSVLLQLANELRNIDAVESVSVPVTFTYEISVGKEQVCRR